ncbi:MAG: ComEC/Rec2 family competence protein [Treponema sp.]|jgi:competence protein ComEC|nr:ComEC/Rec2 family competence protein [Treponema sp.]
MVSPLISAALGAAAVYYVPVPLRLFIPPVCIICVIFGRGMCRRHFAAAAIGTLAGLSAILRIGTFAPGLPVRDIGAVKGTLLEDPRTAGASRQGMAVLDLDETGALPAGMVRASARGKITVFFPALSTERIKESGRGAVVYAEGLFLPPRDINGIPAFRAKTIHTVHAAPAYERVRTGLRANLLERLNSKSWGGLSAALLLGSRENLDGELSGAYRDAGLSHILALSGMHLAFLSGLLALLLKKPLGLRAAIIAGLVFTLAYLAIVGPLPSLVRSAIMYILGSALVLSGGPKAPLPLLGASFLIQLLVFPESPYSLSFIFSYCALAGILILGPGAKELLKGRLGDKTASALAASIGAFIPASPIAAAVFGTLRPAGIIASLVVTPLSTAFMALSLGAFFSASFMDIPLSLLEKSIRLCVKTAAAAPGVSLSLFPALGVSLLCSAALVIASRNRKRRRSYCAPFA